MIIVSQDRKKIINFNNINMVLVRETKIISFDNTYTERQGGDLIGIYKTEERAKEIMMQIIEQYEHTKHKWAF